MAHPRYTAPPPRAAGPDPETEFHLQVANTFRLAIPPAAGFFFHVPNQGKRSRIVGALFKRMGLLPGLSDLVLVAHSWSPGGDASVAFLELKRPDGKGSLSKAQRAFRDEMKARQTRWGEARTLDEACAFARAFYEERGWVFRVTL